MLYMYRSPCVSSLLRCSWVLAGMAHDAAGPHPGGMQLSPEQLAGRWGVSPELAMWWYEHIGRNGMFVKAQWIPLYWNGEYGIMLGVSSPAPNIQYHQDLVVNQENRIITSHEFVWYDCWWYPKLVVFNIAGISNPEFKGFKLEYNLG